MEQTVLNKVKGKGVSLEGANMAGAKAISADFEEAAAARATLDGAPTCKKLWLIFSGNLATSRELSQQAQLQQLPTPTRAHSSESSWAQLTCN